MSFISTENYELEPVLSGDLNDRFYQAVHDKPALFYDVLQTGWLNDAVPYDIILLHSDNVDNNILNQMLSLQDSIARFQEPHKDNVIDYKDEDQIITHYADGGLGLAVLSAEGVLAGQCILSFDDIDSSNAQARIGWVMVDPKFRGNNLFGSLIKLSTDIAKGSGMASIKANVRAHNQKALNLFSSEGFVAVDTAQNKKDLSPNLILHKPVNYHKNPAPEVNALQGQIACSM